MLIIVRRPHWINTLILSHRIYEAHFLPTHITLLIISSSLFAFATPSTALGPIANPRLLHTLLITNYLRIGSGALFITFFALYEKYHRVCVSYREREMIRAGLADRMLGYFSYRSVCRNALDFCWFPIAGMAFGTVPMVVALVCQLWSVKITYRVSRKPLSWGADGVVAP